MKMRTKLVLLTGATLLALAFGLVGIAAAYPDSPAAGTPARRGARTYGVIETIEGTSLGLATPMGSVIVVTDANTVFRIPDGEQADLDGLSAGDHVGVAGWWDENGVFHAFVVAWLANDRSFPVTGKLVTVDDETLIVDTRRGPATVHVGRETVYHIPGVEQPGVADLAVGMRVAARGTLDSDGSLLAQRVAAPRVAPRRNRVRGGVLAIAESTLTVRTARGRRVSVLADAETEFRVPGTENPSIADVQVGDRIAGEVVIDDGGIRAVLVVVLPEQAACLNGEVTGIDGTTLAIRTAGGPVNGLTGDDTAFRIPGVEEPTLSDIGIGSRVTVVGTWEDEATFNAVAVAVRITRRAGVRGTVRGRAISLGTGGLSVGTPRGPVTVRAGDETRYRMPGVDDAGLGDVEPGDLIVVGGTWSEDGTLHAAGLAVLDRK